MPIFMRNLNYINKDDHKYAETFEAVSAAHDKLQELLDAQAKTIADLQKQIKALTP